MTTEQFNNSAAIIINGNSLADGSLIIPSHSKIFTSNLISKVSQLNIDKIGTDNTSPTFTGPKLVETINISSDSNVTFETNIKISKVIAEAGSSITAGAHHQVQYNNAGVPTTMQPESSARFEKGAELSEFSVIAIGEVPLANE